MLVIEDVRTAALDFPELHLTIGNYDGLHLGHQALINAVLENARASNGTAALMTLRPHPAHVFSPETAPKRICSNRQMETRLQAMGLDVLFVLPFTQETAQYDRQHFLQDIVLGNCQAKHLVLGHDFAFGCGAQGNLEYLCEQSGPLGFTVQELAPVSVNGVRISSSRIRSLIAEGELGAVAECLGRPYSMRGKVIKGRGIGGGTLGFPTANLDPSEYVLPPLGIYAAECDVLDEHVDAADTSTPQRYQAAVNLGIAPTLAHDRVMLEPHLLDFEGDLSGKSLEVHFCKYLRPEMKYSTKDALIEAIAQDVAAVRAYFS